MNPTFDERCHVLAEILGGGRRARGEAEEALLAAFAEGVGALHDRLVHEVRAPRPVVAAPAPGCVLVADLSTRLVLGWAIARTTDAAYLDAVAAARARLRAGSRVEVQRLDELPPWLTTLVPPAPRRARLLSARVGAWNFAAVATGGRQRRTPASLARVAFDLTLEEFVAVVLYGADPSERIVLPPTGVCALDAEPAAAVPLAAAQKDPRSERLPATPPPPLPVEWIDFTLLGADAETPNGDGNGLEGRSGAPEGAAQHARDAGLHRGGAVGGGAPARAVGEHERRGEDPGELVLAGGLPRGEGADGAPLGGPREGAAPHHLDRGRALQLARGHLREDGHAAGDRAAAHVAREEVDGADQREGGRRGTEGPPPTASGGAEGRAGASPAARPEPEPAVVAVAPGGTPGGEDLPRDGAGARGPGAAREAGGNPDGASPAAPPRARRQRGAAGDGPLLALPEIKAALRAAYPGIVGLDGLTDNALAGLSVSQRRALHARFLAVPGKVETLAAAGRRLNIGRNAVLFAENAALRALGLTRPGGRRPRTSAAASSEEQDDAPAPPPSPTSSAPPPAPRVTYRQIAGGEEAALIRAYKAGDQRSGERLLKAHEGLIVKRSLRHRGRGLEEDDLIQEGRIAFLKAVEKFDFDKGASLATYSCWWIRAMVGIATVNLGRAVRLPAGVDEKLVRGWRQGLKTAAEFIEAGLLPAEHAHAILSVARAPESLDAPLGHDDDAPTLLDLLASGTWTPEGLYDEAEGSERALEELERLFGVLTPRELEVIKARFGIGRDDPEKLRELGARLDVSRERIRQIETKALRKLRRVGNAKARALAVVAVQPEADDEEDELAVDLGEEEEPLEEGEAPEQHDEPDPVAVDATPADDDEPESEPTPSAPAPRVPLPEPPPSDVRPVRVAPFLRAGGERLRAIQRAVCERLRVEPEQLCGPDRHKPIAFARHVAMYLCKTRLLWSFPEIGGAFGGRDHSTALSAFRKIKLERRTNPEVRAEIDAIERLLAEGEHERAAATTAVDAFAY